MMLAQKGFWDAAVVQLNSAFASAPSRGMVKPIVSYSSARYANAEDMVGFWAAALGLGLTGFIFAQAWSSKHWPTAPAVWAWGPLPILVVIVIGFAVGTLLCSQLELLRRLFVPRKLMTAAVAQRAKQLYHDNCHHNAADDAADASRKRYSMVIYISLYEQIVEIVHGQSESPALDKQLNDARKAILRALKSSNLCSLQEAILNASAAIEDKIVTGQVTSPASLSAADCPLSIVH